MYRLHTWNGSTEPIDCPLPMPYLVSLLYLLNSGVSEIERQHLLNFPFIPQAKEAEEEDEWQILVILNQHRRTPIFGNCTPSEHIENMEHLSERFTYQTFVFSSFFRCIVAGTIGNFIKINYILG